MKCMCAQTRPRFILSSERVFGGMEFEPMLTPREKSPLPENVPRGVSNPRHCGSEPKHYQLSYSGPCPDGTLPRWHCVLPWNSNVVGWLVAYCPSNMLVYLRDGSAHTIVYAETEIEAADKQFLSHPVTVY